MIPILAMAQREQQENNLGTVVMMVMEGGESCKMMVMVRMLGLPIAMRAAVDQR